MIIIIVVDLGEKIAEYESNIFFSLCDLLLPVLLLFFFKFKERDSYVELWQNACSELEKLQEIERVCYVTSLNLIFLQRGNIDNHI